MGAISFFKWIFRGIRRLFDELNKLVVRISEDPVVLRALEADLGVAPGGLAKAKGKTPPDASGIDAYINAVDPDAEQVAVAFEFIGRYVAFWKDIFTAAKQEDASLVVDELVYRLFQLVAVNTVKFRYPTAYYIMRLLGAITQDLRLSVEEAFAPEVPANLFTSAYWKNLGPAFKKNYLVFRLDQAADLFLQPPDPAHPLTPAEVIERRQLGFEIFGLSDLIFTTGWFLGDTSLVKKLLAKLNLEISNFYGWELPPGPDIPLSERIASRAYTLKLTTPAGPPASSSFTLTQLLLAEGETPAGQEPRTGWYLSLRGAVTFEEKAGDEERPIKIKITVETPDGLDARVYFSGEDKFKPTGVPSGGMKLSIEPAQPSTVGPAFSLPETTGTRLEIGDFSFKVEINTNGFKIRASAQKSALVIVPSQGDSFIEESLPPKEIRFDFALGLTADQDGVSIDGGSRFAATIPVNKSLLGISLKTVQLSLNPVAGEGSSELQFAAVASLGFSLGPLSLSVEQIGFTVNAGASGEDQPEDAVSLLPFFYLRDVGFRPPSGVGVLVDSLAVTGGGFLFFDRQNEQYAGVIQLEIADRISIKAIGLLTTRLPDGSKGFSLLVILSVEFDPPIQLVLGFTLGGIGGYLGINRTVDVDVLRAGLHNHTLDAILFPKDPVANAGRILGVLRSVFPPSRGRHLFGLAVILNWGTPPLITAELAVIYEKADNPRLIILGQLHLVAPRKKPILEIHMDAVGIWDYDRQEFSLDARLYDSRVVFIHISGDMALRIRRGTDPFYLLSIGGYHPAFNVPPTFPTLERVKITFADSKNLRLILTGYFAVSSNTRQAGGKIDFFAGFGGFSIEGLIQIDVLWEPDVRYIADFDIKVALKYKGHTLLGAHAVGQLFGPSPNRVKGKVSISLFLFDISKSFDHTFGDDRPPEALPQVNPQAELVAALQDQRSWDAPLPGRSRMLVSLRRRADPQVMVHPLGELSVRQQVLPLGIRIDRFAGGIPSGATIFNITQAAVGGDVIEVLEPVNEFFAPAEFIQMSDDEKLARPSFEAMPAGIRLQPGGLSFGGQAPAAAGQAVTSEMDFDEKTVGADGSVSNGQNPATLPGHLVIAAAGFGAAARSALREAGPARYSAPGAHFRVSQAAYTVSGVDALTTAPLGDSAQAPAGSYTAVQQALEQHLKANPQSRGSLQVVPAFHVEKPS